MIASLRTSCIQGIDAQSVDVEVRCASTQNDGKFTIIGLGDSAVKEARDRVFAAIKQSGFRVPKIVLVNLAPAETRKEGSSFDLAIALGVLVASRQISQLPRRNQFFYGELSLDGRIKPVRGIIALIIAAVQSGASQVVVPAANYHEACLIKGVEIIPVRSLPELAEFIMTGNLGSVPERPSKIIADLKKSAKSIADVWGQGLAKRALTIAAAGGHNVLMIGPPGCGKSMLANRFSTLLPKLREEEALEVVKIHSVAGLPIENYLQGARPFRNPHHIVSDVGLIGGGTNPRPGEISLAHNGVLFLDEFPEYRRSVIEALRAPLENGTVQITRARGSFTFPARFQLLAAMNPCPCGRMGINGKSCLCSRPAILAYLRKLSEPILDRIDMHVELDAVPVTIFSSNIALSDFDESAILNQIIEAQERQYADNQKLNSTLEAKDISLKCTVKDSALKLLENAAKKIGLSARGYSRVLRVAKTIADLDAQNSITDNHVAEAISFRGLEKLKAMIA